MKQLIITLIEEGDRKQVTISGPLNDRYLCYAMLEGAKDIVREYKTPIIQPVRILPREIEPQKG